MAVAGGKGNRSGAAGLQRSTMLRRIVAVTGLLLAGCTAAFAQSDAVNSYEQAVGRFKAILSERQAQISSHQRLPDLPGQALYRARNDIISTYKDLTDAFPGRIGRPNKFGIPPAYFDAANTLLLDEYRELFKVMQAPPAAAQYSDTPFKDVVELGTAIARAKGLNAADAAVAGRISLGIFFAETNGMQKSR